MPDFVQTLAQRAPGRDEPFQMHCHLARGTVHGMAGKLCREVCCCHHIPSNDNLFSFIIMVFVIVHVHLSSWSSFVGIVMVLLMRPGGRGG